MNISNIGIESKLKLSAKAKASLSKMLAKIQAGDLSPLTKVVTFQIPEDSPAQKWSYRNKVLAFAQSGRLDCRGYRQWQKDGRQVKKGSNGAFIWSPRTRKVTDEKTGEEKQVFAGFRLISVFADTDTEGDEPLPDYTPKSPPPLADIAAKLGVNVKYQPMIQALGDCTTNGKQIRLATGDVKVFFHELAHAAHAKIDGRLNGGQQVGQETIAEFTALVLMDLYGLGDRSGDAWQYINGYSKDPLKAFTTALAKVEQVLDLILSVEGEGQKFPDQAGFNPVGYSVDEEIDF